MITVQDLVEASALQDGRTPVVLPSILMLVRQCWEVSGANRRQSRVLISVASRKQRSNSPWVQRSSNLVVGSKRLRRDQTLMRFVTARVGGTLRWPTRANLLLILQRLFYPLGVCVPRSSKQSRGDHPRSSEKSKKSSCT